MVVSAHIMCIFIYIHTQEIAFHSNEKKKHSLIHVCIILHLKIFLATVTDCHTQSFSSFHFSGSSLHTVFCFLFFSIKHSFFAVSPCFAIFLSFILVLRSLVHSLWGWAQTLNLNRTKERKEQGKTNKKYFTFSLRNRNACVCIHYDSILFFFYSFTKFSCCRSMLSFLLV